MVDAPLAAGGFDVDLERPVRIGDEGSDELLAHAVGLDMAARKLDNDPGSVADRGDRVLHGRPPRHDQSIGIFRTLVAAVHVVGEQQLRIRAGDDVARPHALDFPNLGVKQSVASGGGTIEVQRPPGEGRQQHRGSQRRLKEPTPGNELAGRRRVERAQQSHALGNDQLAREGLLRLKLVCTLQRRQEGRFLGRNQAERSVPPKPEHRLDRPGHGPSGHPEHQAPSDAQPDERRHRPENPGHQHERR